MNKLLTFTTLFFIGVIINSCRKEKKALDQLPPATQIGANTMGCLVNGKLWLPDTRDNGSIPRLKAIYVDFWNNGNQLLMTFYRQKHPDNQTLEIFIKDFHGVGKYIMDSTSRIIGIPGSSGPLKNYCNFSDNNSKTDYLTNGFFLGQVSITFYDPVNKVILGSFSFKAQNLNGTLDSVVVTDGRFDCKMY